MIFIRSVSSAGLLLLVAAASALVISTTTTPASAQESGICSRTQQVQDVILDRLSGVTDCADVTSDNLASITGHLNLSNRLIASLNPGDFDGLSGVTRVSLSDNFLLTVPSGLFAPMASGMTRIDILRNSITLLPADAFSGMTSLAWLDLRGNRMETLPAGLFSGLASLTRLNLSSNGLTSISATDFSGLAALEQLDLGLNKFTGSFPAAPFTELSALTRLKISGTAADFLAGEPGLATLPSGAFTGLSALTRLELERMPITSLPANVFGPLTALERAEITSTDLTTLPEGAFSASQSLSILDLALNASMTSLPEDLLADGVALKELYLRETPIAALPAELLLALASATKVQLPTGLTEWPMVGLTTMREPWALPLTLVELTVEGNSTLSSLPDGVLETLPSPLSKLTVRNITLSDDVLTAIGNHPPATSRSRPDWSFLALENTGLTPTKLTNLLVAWCTPDQPAPTLDNCGKNNWQGPLDFQVIGDDLSGWFGSSLDEGDLARQKAAAAIWQSNSIALRDNQMTATEMDALLSSLYTGVRDLNTSGNNLSGLSANLTRFAGDNAFDSLTLLEISSSSLGDTGAAHVISTVPRFLDHLNLNGNGIATLPAFPSDTMLRTIRFEENSLSSLSAGVFDNLTALENVYLGHNALTSLPEDLFDTSPRLRLVVLDENSLETLPTDLFTDNTNLQFVYLEENPIGNVPTSYFSGLSKVSYLYFGDRRANLGEVARYREVMPSLFALRMAGDPEVTISFGSSTYTVAEGAGVTVTVELDVDPERTVTIPLTATNENSASNADYSGVPPSVVFDSGETSKTFTFTATQDTADDDGERVRLAFGTLPSGVSEGTTDETVVSITDDDDPAVSVSFGSSTYTVDEGDTVEVTVTLDQDPERTVVIPLSRENLGGTSDSDYSGVPQNVTFNSGDTSRTFTVAATQDKLSDGGEGLKLTFGTLPPGVSEGSPKEARVAITDSQVQGSLTVSFRLGAIAVAEGSTAQVTVLLSQAPGSDVTIPLMVTEQDGATSSDYSGVPQNVTFNSSDTEQTFTFTATQDTVDDDGESVKLTFGILPSGVLAGTVGETLLSIIDDDLPASLTVSFGQSAYTVAEGGTVEITVTLDDDPERTVVVPLTATEQDGATSSDYSGVPQSVTFDSGDTSKAFTFTATQDTADDDGERVRLAFDTLPTGITAGTPDETVVSITDDDDPAVSVSFRSPTYTVAEGAGVTVTVELDVDPERTVTIPLTATNENSASNADYSGVPPSVVFDSGETSKTFTFTATQDTADDDGERVRLAFGTLPSGVSEGTTDETVVSITDDGMGVGETTGQNRVCTKGEITVRGQTDRWVWRITDSSYWDEYTIDLMGLHSNKGTLRDPHIVYITKIYTHDGFYPPAGSAYGSFPSYASNDGGVGWDSSSRLRFRNRTGSYSYFPGKEPELDTGYYTVLVGANPFGDGANGLGSYTLCIEGPGSISAVDQPERRIVVSAAHVDVSDGEPAQFSIKLGARPTGSVEVFMTKLEPASDSQYVVEPLMHSFTVDNWDIPQVVTVRQKADYMTPEDDSFVIHYWGKGGGYHKAFEFLEVYDRVPRWMTLRLTVDPEPALTDQVSEAQKQNSPATGGPGIQGMARVGETLTATTSGLRDEDGLDNAVFAYQWVRAELGAQSGEDIAGATGSSYVVTADDVGKAISVRVSFTDDAGNEESAPSSHAVVAATALPQTRAPDPPGAPDVSPHESGSLAVSWTAPASDGGSAITGYKVQWKEAADSWDTPADVSEAATTGASHTITGLTDGTAYAVRVLAINDIGEGLPSDDGEGTPRETVPPELSGASVDGATLTLTFNEALDEDSKPATTAFTVTVGGNVRAADYVDVIGGAVTLTLASAVTSQDTVTVSYAVPASESAERLRDAVGNAAASFIGRSVTNDTGPAAPLTASVHDAPESHDGQSEFTFELRFSEAPRRGFSYKTLRDHAFTVDGGEVLRARRLEPGKNVRWEITVRPDSNGAVTIVLPVTTDCNAQGAVCTGDGRMLAGPSTLTVAGPG